MTTPEVAGDLHELALELSPDTCSTAAQAAAATLRDEIMNGAHFSGEQLRETRLAAQLKVSRNTIREAYRKLEGEGLLIHKPHQGVYVATFDERRIAQLYAFRRSAECGTVYSLSAARARDLGARLTEIINDDQLTTVERNNRFHLAIVAASGSPELLSAAKSIQAQLQLCFVSYPESDALHLRFAGRHPAIADALLAGNISDATEALGRYFSESIDAVTVGLAHQRD